VVKHFERYFRFVSDEENELFVRRVHDENGEEDEKL